jgi:hypothetical protein
VQGVSANPPEFPGALQRMPVPRFPVNSGRSAASVKPPVGPGASRADFEHPPRRPGAFRFRIVIPPDLPGAGQNHPAWPPAFSGAVQCRPFKSPKIPGALPTHFVLPPAIAGARQEDPRTAPNGPWDAPNRAPRVLPAGLRRRRRAGAAVPEGVADPRGSDRRVNPVGSGADSSRKGVEPGGALPPQPVGPR